MRLQVYLYFELGNRSFKCLVLRTYQYKRLYYEICALTLWISLWIEVQVLTPAMDVIKKLELS